jgi:alpha/beta superfamily hydrolase
MEAKIYFPSNGIRLEGLLALQSATDALVVTHPHPLYGGDMRNPVVEQVVEVYQAQAYTTLRFNFRGVGNSEGLYTDGAGEKTDLRAAVELLKQKQLQAVTLAGYSFGAWVNAQVPQVALPLVQAVMISPPVALMDFDAIGTIPNLRLVVSGDNDEIAPPDMIRSLLPRWNPEAQFEVIPGADHFYSGRLSRLARVLSEVVSVQNNTQT